MGEKLLTLNEAAEKSGFSASHLAYAARHGLLKAQKFGNTWVVSEEALEAWMSDTAAHKRGRKKD